MELLIIILAPHFHWEGYTVVFGLLVSVCVKLMSVMYFSIACCAVGYGSSQSHDQSILRWMQFLIFCFVVFFVRLLIIFGGFRRLLTSLDYAIIVSSSSLLELCYHCCFVILLSGSVGRDTHFSALVKNLSGTPLQHAAQHPPLTHCTSLFICGICILILTLITLHKCILLPTRIIIHKTNRNLNLISLSLSNK